MAISHKLTNVIGAHIKQVDPHHLYLDTTGIFRAYPKVIDNPSRDLVTFEFYPHWDSLLGGGASPTTAETFTRDAATVTARGNAFIVNEFGWDRTNWKTPGDLQHVLDILAHDPNISGDGFWALQAHLDNFGFQLIPADSRNSAFAESGECGEWWALYYPGVKTLVNTAEDMAARAQQLRTHAFAMTGTPVPKHAVPPPPVITSTVLGGPHRLARIRRRCPLLSRAHGSNFETVADHLRQMRDRHRRSLADPHPVLFGASYRVTAWNADGIPSPPSQPR